MKETLNDSYRPIEPVMISMSFPATLVSESLAHSRLASSSFMAGMDPLTSNLSSTSPSSASNANGSGAVSSTGAHTTHGSNGHSSSSSNSNSNSNGGSGGGGLLFNGFPSRSNGPVDSLGSGLSSVAEPYHSDRLMAMAMIPEEHPSTWLTTLRYICDDVMAKTSTHIQVLPPLTMSYPGGGLYNITILGSHAAALQARSLIREAGIHQTKQIMHLPVKLIPYLDQVKSRVEEVVHQWGVLARWSSVAAPPPLLSLSLPSAHSQHADALSPPLATATTINTSSSLAQVNLELSGPTEALMKARAAIVILFDEIMDYASTSFDLDPMLVTLAAGPYRSIFYELMSETGTHIYLPRCIRAAASPSVEEKLASPLALSPSSPSQQEPGQQEGLEGEDRERSVGWQEKVYISGPSEKEINLVKERVLKCAQAKKSSMVSRSITAGTRKLEVAITDRALAVESILNENGAYASILWQPESQSSMLTIYSDNVYSVEAALKSLCELLCSYHSAELYLSMTPSLSLFSPTHAAADLAPQMSPIQPYSSVMKMKGFQSDVQELRMLSQDCGLEIFYHTNVVELHGTSAQLLRGLESAAHCLFIQNALLEVKFNLEQPLDVKEFVCGKKDGKLNKVMRATGALIKISLYHDWSICICIHSQSVAAALEGYAMVEGELPSDLNFYVPEVHHKRIIGHGGKNIQKIMKAFGVYVKFLNNEEIRLKYGLKSPLSMMAGTGSSSSSSSGTGSAPGSPTNFESLNWSTQKEFHANVLVKTPAKNSSALMQMKNAILELSGERDYTPVSETVPVPAHYHYWILSQTQKLRDLTRNTQVQIYWPPFEWHQDEIYLKGCAFKIPLAKQLLLEMMPKYAPVYLAPSSGLLGFLGSHDMESFMRKSAKDWRVTIGLPPRPLLAMKASLAGSADKYCLLLQSTQAFAKNVETAEKALREFLKSHQIETTEGPEPYRRDIRRSSYHLASGSSGINGASGSGDLTFASYTDEHGRARETQGPPLRQRSQSLGSQEAFRHFNSVLLSNAPPMQSFTQENDDLVIVSPPSQQHATYTRKNMSPTGTIGDKLGKSASGAPGSNSTLNSHSHSHSNGNSNGNGFGLSKASGGGGNGGVGAKKESEPNGSKSGGSDYMKSPLRFSANLLDGIEMSEEQKKKKDSLFISSIASWRTPIISERRLDDPFDHVLLKPQSNVMMKAAHTMSLSSPNASSPHSSPNLNGKAGTMATSSSAGHHFGTLEDFLSSLDLSKYHGLLTQQEVDLDMLLTLSDEDLKELGIQPFGPRRKLVQGIQQLRASQPGVALEAKPSTDRLSKLMI